MQSYVQFIDGSCSVYLVSYQCYHFKTDKEFKLIVGESMLSVWNIRFLLTSRCLHGAGIVIEILSCIFFCLFHLSYQ